MHQSPPIHHIFVGIEKFVVDYVTLIQTIHNNASHSNNSLLTIKLLDDVFLVPATFQTFSQRAQALQHRLQRQIRTWAQTRRSHITRGIDVDDQPSGVVRPQRFDGAWKAQLDQLQNTSSDSETGQMLRYVQTIVDSLEFYDEMLEQTQHHRNQTFRCLPILQNVQKQLCCISINIQRMLDTNSSAIDQHLRQLQKKVHAYHQDMQSKLTNYISRDIRPPVLVIPCPADNASPELFTKIRLANRTGEDDDQTDVRAVSSEDSLT